MRSDVEVLTGLHEVERDVEVRQSSRVRLTGRGRSLGFADPVAGLGYAYVTSQMGTALTGDPRDVALRSAIRASCRSHRPHVAGLQPAI
jgi:hypothetical protein